MILIVYQSKKVTRFRLVKYTMLKVGEETSMGWLVLSIQYYYEGRFYIKHLYDELITQEINGIVILNKKRLKVKKIIDFLYHISR